MRKYIKGKEANLINMMKIAKVKANEIIWARLAPITDEIHNSRKEGFLRFNKDICTYDAAAKEIMMQYNIQMRRRV